MRPTYIYILLGLLSFMLPSCLKDNKEIFDKPAAARIDASSLTEKPSSKLRPRAGVWSTMLAETTRVLASRS